MRPRIPLHPGTLFPLVLLCGSLMGDPSPTQAAPNDGFDPRDGVEQRDPRGGRPGGDQARPSTGRVDARPPAAARQPQPPAAPPADFSQARRDIRAHREVIGRGPDAPPGLRLVKGQPLPSGYGKRLPPPVLAQLPRYDGYEWRRVGGDMVLLALVSGIVYEVLTGVLD